MGAYGYIGVHRGTYGYIWVHVSTYGYPYGSAWKYIESVCRQFGYVGSVYGYVVSMYGNQRSV